jgi:hypothetical protein
MSDNTPERKKVEPGWGVGLALGLAVGVAIGVSMGNIGLGIAIGAGIGIAFAFAFSDLNPAGKKKPDDPGATDQPPGGGPAS